jgi:uncharacterized protein (DUF608 family)
MNTEKHPKCQEQGCRCGTPDRDAAAFGRRDFLRLVGAGATGVLAFHPWQFAMAGPFTRADFDKLVPADKKLSPEWVRSLTARGEPEVYRGADLVKIGMPVGGICAGQLYLGGDGKLWHWDLFNTRIGTGAEHYAKPLEATSPLEQGFALRIVSGDKAQERPLDRDHWSDVSFAGEYPIGYVEYKDPGSPLEIRLEAFSPFIPLNTDDSSLPATVLQFTVKNHSSAKAEAELAGWLENAICLNSAKSQDGVRRNRLVRDNELLFLECSAEDVPSGAPSQRPDIVFEDFEGETYANWTVTGTAFGAGPVEMSKIPDYQGDVRGKGKRVANSHASAPGGSVEEKDAATGKLVSRAFSIERNYITLLVGGGAHKGQTCVNLTVDDKVVLTATGFDENAMRPLSWDVRKWAGRTGRLQIVDNATGAWGNIGVDDIVFSDKPRVPVGPLKQQADFGTMGVALLDPQPGDRGCTALPGTGAVAGVFETAKDSAGLAKRGFDQKLVGSLTRKLKLKPGESATAVFVLSWHLPNLKMDRLPPGRYYGARFNSALGLARYIRQHFARLSGETRLWHDTWYDGSLPWWFLDRTFLNTSILATSTCYRFGDGRFYGWEGVGCCEGTCGHVWQYAHAVARLFPDLERMTREKVDFGLALQPDGAIHFRGEFNNIPAIDAQAGTILRALREHQMSADSGFLKRNWPRIRAAVEWLIAKDENGDGLIESNQHNTLDTDWYGPVAWLSGLYLAALRAAEQMAIEAGDAAFAEKCRAIFDAGQKNIVAQLYEDGYFVNKPSPKHLDAINSGTGCHIDQVMGQSWAFQVALPRVFPQKETLSALQSLWRYNFTPDVGPYREVYKAGRWYAMPGEAGLLMCTFPRSDWNYDQAKGKGADWAAGYFNECMNGFEYQVAGHMIWEGMITEGLAATRAVHDRYHPSRRNPWNEVECGDHYARSMASYGVFLAACGFEYHGPKGHLGFAPRIHPEQFKAAFTAAEGWGTFSQQAGSTGQNAVVEVKWGKLRLRSLSLELMGSLPGGRVKVTADGRPVETKETLAGTRLTISFQDWVELRAHQRLEVAVA